MVGKAKKLLGIEIIPQAIENARENALKNGIKNAEFICSDASSAAKRLTAEKANPDVIVIDPPRKGCDNTVIDAVCTMSPKRVVYVSCDPETLARDLSVFSQKGYVVGEVTPVDMFPRTQHVETVVLMSAASRRSQNEKSELERYGEYFMNRSVLDIMSECSEQHAEWH